MLTIALVPVVGVSLLFLLSVFVLSKHAAKLALVRRETDEEQHRILKKADELESTLINDLADAKRMDESVSTYNSGMASLLPGANLESPADWDAEDLQRWHRARLREQSEAVNRNLLFPASMMAVLIIATCIVTGAILYHFRSAEPPAVFPPVSPMPAFSGSGLPGPYAPPQIYSSDVPPQSTLPRAETTDLSAPPGEDSDADPSPNNDSSDPPSQPTQEGEVK